MTKTIGNPITKIRPIVSFIINPPRITSSVMLGISKFSHDFNYPFHEGQRSHRGLLQQYIHRHHNMGKRLSCNARIGHDHAPRSIVQADRRINSAAVVPASAALFEPRCPQCSHSAFPSRTLFCRFIHKPDPEARHRDPDHPDDPQCLAKEEISHQC